MRPPAVRVEKSPVWDFIGVTTAVAILQYQGMISVERQARYRSTKRFDAIERAPRDST